MIAKDDYIIVLDFLPHGKPMDRRSEPIAQGLGEKYFNLLEVAVKDGIVVKPKEKLYVGDGKRDKVKYIRGRINYNDLTGYAKSTLMDVLNNLIDSDEKRFVNFFNNAGPISTRMHSLELLPGIGKKHLWKIIEERKKKPFETFKDLRERIVMLPDPKRIIIRRIINELENKDRYRLFVASNKI